VSVSHKDYTDARLADLRSYIDMRFEEGGRATKVALDAANEKGLHHNGVLETLRVWQQRTITWPILLSCLIGAGAGVGIYSQITP
jgi:hypothetical protein